MRALISRRQIPASEGSLLVESGELWCLVTEDDQTPEGSRRLPVMIAARMMRRDSAIWHYPPTASEGHRLLADMTASWLSSLNTSSVSQPRVYRPESSALASKPRNSIVDAQAARSRGGWRK